MENEFRWGGGLGSQTLFNPNENCVRKKAQIRKEGENVGKTGGGMFTY